MKKLILVLIACMAVFSASEALASKKIAVKIATYYGSTHPVQQSLEFFKENLEKESGGRFDVQLFPNNQLGSEEVYIDLVKRGSIQMGVCGLLIKKDEAKTALAVPPFVIETWKQAYDIFNGPIGRKIVGDYTKNTNVHILGYMVNGFRNISSNYLINDTASLAKIKIRVPTSDVFVRMFQGFRCNTVMMPMGEVYNALETKVVDGQDNPLATLKASGWWEVQSHVLMSNHMFASSPIIVNGKFLDSIPQDLRPMFDANLQKAIEHNWALSQKDEEDCIAFFKEKGLTLTTPTPEFRKQMRAALNDYFEWYYKEIPGAREIIAEMEAMPK